MSSTSCPVARAIIKPHREKVFSLVGKYVEDRRGPFVGALRPRQVTESMGIYVTEKRGEEENQEETSTAEILKTGSTKRFLTRRGYYSDKVCARGSICSRVRRGQHGLGSQQQCEFVLQQYQG